MHALKHFHSRIFALLLIAILAGCATQTNPVTGKQDRFVMSEQDEINSGRQIHQQVLQEYPAYNNPALQQYVSAVGQKLASQSERANLPWTFTVVDSPEINAFAVQGGFIYITRGLMAYLNSEAELAGVLGHEIGHVTARHGARADRDQKIAVGTQLLATILGAYVGGEQGAQLGSQLGGTVAQGSFLLPRSRDHELQADRLGAAYLQKTNFDPDIMLNVIKVLKAQEIYAQDEARAAGRQLNQTPNWLRTHPANDDRLNAMQQVADQYTGKYADPGRNRYLQAINGMTYGDSREHGVTRGQDFYHEPLGFTLRANPRWQIQNSPNELTIFSNDMNAAVSIAISSQSRGDHNAAIRAMLQPDQGRVEQTMINGLRATNFFGAKQNQPIDATVVTLGNNDYILRRLQKADAKGAYDRELREITNSFRAMTPADAANAKPYTLRTVASRSAAPFAELSRDFSRVAPQIRNTEGQLRLLNQVYPQGNVAAGQLVKVVQ
jgi:predicted Zn-dependent protease